MAINPYMVKIGDKKNPLEINAHRGILRELNLEDLPFAKSFNINHVEDIIYNTHTI